MCIRDRLIFYLIHAVHIAIYSGPRFVAPCTDHIEYFTHSLCTHTAPGDYEQRTNTSYIFTPGKTRLDIPVSIVNDDQFEDTEQFQGLLTTSNAVGAIIDVPITTVETTDNACKVYITIRPW